ncbi:MAG TPA: hypothetical protein VJN70_05710 [Gemmatimonadaceae bacterium]|nr:hypothetical protein [Gemmatimonadaceae bacterium]
MDLDRIRSRAEWEITVGQLTVAAILFARLITVYLQLTAAGPLDPTLFGQAVLKSGLLILVLVLYRRFAWPSLLMLAVWPIGFLYAWLGPPHATPRVLRVGLLIGAGFFIGTYGVRSLRRVRALESSPAVAA